MATIVNFFGRTAIEPGSYSISTYSPTSVVNVSEFGNIVLIDTGASKFTINGTASELSGGSGSKGFFSSGLKSVYSFENYEDFFSFMNGGYVSDFANKLFSPIEGSAGTPKLLYVRCAQTVPAKISLSITDPTDADARLEYISLTAKNEGLVGNAIYSGGKLRLGYSVTVTKEDSSYRFSLYRGSFMGMDKSGEPFGAKKLADAEPNLIVQSPLFKLPSEVIEWMRSDKLFMAHFDATLTSTAVTSLETGVFDAKGGTTSDPSTSLMAEILESIAEEDISFILTTDDATKATTFSDQILTYIKNDAKFDQYLFIPGGYKDDDLRTTSFGLAKHFNSSKVVVTHGAPVVLRKDQNGTKTLDPIYLTAAILGLNAGMQPQTPLTFKRVGYQSFYYDLKKKEREDALQAGVMHVRNVSGYWVVNQGITTLQDNKKTIADDGQSFELSIELIKAQLNKELILEGQVRFTGQTAAQASPQSVKNFVETKLTNLVAYPGNDNLLLNWTNVKVSAKNSDYFITYDFVPNVPVNKTFFIGNVLDFIIS